MTAAHTPLRKQGIAGTTIAAADLNATISEEKRQQLQDVIGGFCLTDLLHRTGFHKRAKDTSHGYA
jgi:hypothetical protein